jgi:preprotein translocase subunit SecA
MAETVGNYGVDVMRMVEKSLLLQILDQLWKEHLLSLDHLRQGIGLRAYGQRDPLNEYKREAFTLFEGMLDRLRERVTQVLAHVELRMDPGFEQALQPPAQRMRETREDPAFAEEGGWAEAFGAGAGPDPIAPAGAPAGVPTGAHTGGAKGNGAERPMMPSRSRVATETFDRGDPATWGRVARNAPCPCGSGKKFKHCHGRPA